MPAGIAQSTTISESVPETLQGCNSQDNLPGVAVYSRSILSLNSSEAVSLASKVEAQNAGSPLPIDRR
jgi:hypothetical protein